MATAHLHINGIDYDLADEVTDKDPNFAGIQEKVRQLIAGGPGMATFQIKRNGAVADLHVAADQVFTAAAWIKPTPPAPRAYSM